MDSKFQPGDKVIARLQYGTLAVRVGGTVNTAHRGEMGWAYSIRTPRGYVRVLESFVTKR